MPSYNKTTMVKFCTDPYPKKNEDLYAEYFEKYSFPLSSFQKFAIEAIVEGHHSLSCVPTGSGKTMPALFAIDFFTQKGKKVIYTSPIKALSNQKYHEFTKTFPHISIGLLTGDIKINPEADVLIMTAEILQNTLYRKKQKHNLGDITTSPLLMFDMDFDVELGCVIQDEIHMINDADRGHVWESIILLLPQHIQMVMLSATLDKPEKFAHWIETRGGSQNSSDNKQVYLATSNFRHVPLTHYSFITCNNGIFKAVKDKTLEKEIRGVIDKLHVIQNATGEFQEQNYHKIKKMLTLFEQKQVYVKRSHILNQVCKYMVENNMLPAVCFILSRKQIETACHEITVPLLEDDSKVGYIVRKECEQILRSKLPNFQEYLELPEYLDVVRLLEKGIAIHHSGVMPILREIVEILFEKGYIKFLFATETFSVGLNMPIKTAIFTDVKKFDGSIRRMLYPHEYNQASGRAGRRGLDTVGHVIHLSNLFKDIDLPEYRTMMQGKPQTLVSKFKISYHLILNLISIGNHNYVEFCKRSMIQDELNASLGVLYKQMTDCQREVDEMNQPISHYRTPYDIVNRYIDLLEIRSTSVNKKRKEAEKEILVMQDTYKFIDSDKANMLLFRKKKLELDTIQNHFELTETFLNRSIQIILDKMQLEGFITKDAVKDDDDHEDDRGDDHEEDATGKTSLTLSGLIACQLREVHCLVFANLCNNNIFDQFNTKQLIAIFSCFTNITVGDEQKSFRPNSKDKAINTILTDIAKQYQDYQEFESQNNASTGIDYTIHYDLIDYMIEWCHCETAIQCKGLLQTLEKNKGIFLGEFVKAIAKINNISCEMEKIAEMIGNISLLSKLKEIPELTLKFVATNQSLYV